MNPHFFKTFFSEILASWIYVALDNGKLCKFSVFSMDGYLWRGHFLTHVLEMLNHHNKFMLFRPCYIVIIFLSMNEEIHESFNIPLYVSSQNDSLLHP